MRPILIVEDHPLVAEATGELLTRFGDDIRTVVCPDAASGLARLDHDADGWFRILLDLDVPGAYGLSLAREVQRRSLAGRCCIVSAFEDRGYVDEMRDSGFLGYIVKATPMSEFKDALGEVLSGKAWFPKDAANRRTPAIRLTQRQTQLLELVRIGMSSKEMACALHIAEGTVHNHIAAILQLFDASTRAQVVARAIELGLIEARHRSTPFSMAGRTSSLPDERCS